MPAGWPRLAVIGTAAGVVSGLFGVGGGAVIVPLLILWMGFEERPAAGTSLAASALIAVLAAGGHSLYGNVDLAAGLLLGVPAAAGVVAGTALQQRLPAKGISLAFAALLTASALALIF